MFVFECLDRSLREVTKIDAEFGGITTVFSGDWRQCLPIVKHGGRGDVVDACLKSSYLWKKMIEKNLTRNMRVQQKGESKAFSDLLLKIGDGKLIENNTMGENMVGLPEELFIGLISGQDLAESTYFPQIHHKIQGCVLGEK